jgi:hypothetical protein
MTSMEKRPIPDSWRSAFFAALSAEAAEAAVGVIDSLSPRLRRPRKKKKKRKRKKRAPTRTTQVTQLSLLSLSLATRYQMLWQAVWSPYPSHVALLTPFTSSLFEEKPE